VRAGERWLLITERDIVDDVVRKLKMFVLRAAVTIAPDDDSRIAAIVGADGAWLAARSLPPAAQRDALLQRGSLRFIHLGSGLWQVHGPQEALEGFEPSLERAPAARAILEEIRLGIPALPRALADRYVPQMLNLERLDALSFDKGCYPGQEVVARVRHLGAVKRRLRRYAAEAETEPAPGTPVVAPDGQSAGEIVRAARAPSGYEALAVVDDAAAGLTLLAGGARLREQPLP
jgi:folate-binding protein YgfZ